jgi:hypothetical protein
LLCFAAASAAAAAAASAANFAAPNAEEVEGAGRDASTAEVGETPLPSARDTVS